MVIGGLFDFGQPVDQKSTLVKSGQICNFEYMYGLSCNEMDIWINDNDIEFEMMLKMDLNDQPLEHTCIKPKPLTKLE